VDCGSLFWFLRSQFVFSFTFGSMFTFMFGSRSVPAFAARTPNIERLNSEPNIEIEDELRTENTEA